MKRGSAGYGLHRKPKTTTTRDHDEIKTWVERHDGLPSFVRGTEDDDGTGLLRIDFPGGADEDEFDHVEWEKWFATFDDRDLSFLYQEQKASGSDSTFFKLIRE